MIDAEAPFTERPIDQAQPHAPATMRAIVQISLDLLSIDEALTLAEFATQCGVDWLEVGTPLIISHGMVAVRELRAAFPRTPIVADLQTMDGQGHHLRHYLNGVQTIDLLDNDAKHSPKQGLLALQLHCGEPMWVEFKNVRLKQLTANTESAW